MGIARQGKVVDIAWMPMPSSMLSSASSSSAASSTGATVLAIAGEDGQLSFLEASHPGSAAKNRPHAFQYLPGSGRPLPLVCPAPPVYGPVGIEGCDVILLSVLHIFVPAFWISGSVNMQGEGPEICSARDRAQRLACSRSCLSGPGADSPTAITITQELPELPIRCTCPAPLPSLATANPNLQASPMTGPELHGLTPVLPCTQAQPSKPLDQCVPVQDGLQGANPVGAAQLLPAPWLQLLRMLLHAAVLPSVLRQLITSPGALCGLKAELTGVLHCAMLNLLLSLGHAFLASLLVHLRHAISAARSAQLLT